MASPTSYLPNYFSITDILATEERLQCLVITDLPRLGCLDPASESVDLKANTKLELPYWLIQFLSVSQRPIVNIEDIPKIYKEGYREILNADACAVDLCQWSQFYYELGMHLSKLNNRECEKITESLLRTFKTRFRLIMDLAQNPVAKSSHESRLPVLERELYLAGKKAKIQLNNWLEKGVDKIETSEIVANMKKRKRTDFEIN